MFKIILLALIHGSLAMGGFNPSNSDIDILIVTEKSLGIELKRRLAQLFLATSNHPFPVEVSCLSRELFNPFEHPCPFDFHYSEIWRERYEEDLSLETYEFLNGDIKKDPDLAAHLTITFYRGICIEGKPIVEVFPPIPESFYTSSIMGDFYDCIENILEEPVYCTLNLIRVYWYLKEGFISSKEEAGNWGISSLPKEMLHTLQKVMDNYCEQDTHSFEVNELLIIRNYIEDNVKELLS